jgi:predicted TIM-barrel fold metal-dependent hydrolase
LKKRQLIFSMLALPYSIVIIVSVLIQVLLAQTSADKLLLKDYRPKSIYNIPKTFVPKAKYPAIDIHTHSYAKSPEDIVRWVKLMDEVGIEKTIVLTGSTGARFDSIFAKFNKFPGRFEVWCGFDYTDYDKPGFGPAAVAELERCARIGAQGVGELGDLGWGMYYSRPVKAWGMHFDDPRLDPLLQKCGKLGLPVSIHVGNPLWYYQTMDSTNDALFCGFGDHNSISAMAKKTEVIDLDGMLEILKRGVGRHKNTTFIVCHFACCSHDLGKLGKLLDTHQNLYADISSQYAETANIPRFVKAFYEKYQDKLVYGTDFRASKHMYQTTYRILESNDEHFYETEIFEYHWSQNGFGLSDQVLKKLYRQNALKILGD